MQLNWTRTFDPTENRKTISRLNEQRAKFRCKYEGFQSFYFWLFGRCCCYALCTSWLSDISVRVLVHVSFTRFMGCFMCANAVFFLFSFFFSCSRRGMFDKSRWISGLYASVDDGMYFLVRNIIRWFAVVASERCALSLSLFPRAPFVRLHGCWWSEREYCCLPIHRIYSVRKRYRIFYFKIIVT